MTHDHDHDHERFADWDAAYVLGALTPPDRRAYEAHLEDCARCRAAVAELASMPGLLGRLAPGPVGLDPAAEPEAAAESGAAAGAAEDASPPADLVDRVVARRARGRRARARVVMLAVAAAVVVAAAIAVPLALEAPVHPDESVALVPIEGDPPIAASVDLTAVDWGTRIEMRCAYDEAAAWGGGEGPWAYALVITDADGRESQVSSWKAIPGRAMRLEAATAVELGEIRSIEVRTSGGAPVLRAELGGG
ncbi:anti-sigma factor family protein [Agromyces sp. MMS24-JH15]|uniref:anti-sigma factor family protein n=1 Tax=Agromyces sp. MMS24-JH15 TaxID=3243765 RepID=UPI0037478ACB